MCAIVVGLIALGSTAGCVGLADLRTPEFQAATPAELAGMRVRGAAALEKIGTAYGLREYRRWQSGQETLEIILIDDWASGFLRGFTPLPEDRTRLLLQITAAPQKDAGSPTPTIFAYSLGSSEAIPLAGDRGSLKNRVHFGIHPHGPAARTESYALAAASGPQNQSASGAEQKFERLLVTPGGSTPAETRDQFLLWYESGSGLIRFVEFTYRDVFSFYQGALLYPADAKAGDFPAGLPARVSITDGVAESEAVHTLLLESARLIRTTASR